ncbi:MAG: hypothetical protein ABFC77_12945 [Thermoguttaceae bacterium]
MDLPVIIRGTFCNKTFVPTDPLPEAEGPAELIVHATLPIGRRPSIDEVFGAAEHLRTAEDLDAQLAEERAVWGDA